MDSIWHQLLKVRMNLDTGKLREITTRHPSARAGYLSEVAMLIPTKERDRPGYKSPFLQNFWRSNQVQKLTTNGNVNQNLN